MSPEGVFEQASREHGCRAAVAGATVYLRCEASAGRGLSSVGQAEAMLNHAESLLMELGTRLEYTKRVVIGVTDGSARAAIVGLAEEWLRHIFPADTGVIVPGMARQGVLLELVIIAEIPQDLPYPRRTT